MAQVARSLEKNSKQHAEFLALYVRLNELAEEHDAKVKKYFFGLKEIKEEESSNDEGKKGKRTIAAASVDEAVDAVLDGSQEKTAQVERAVDEALSELVQEEVERAHMASQAVQVERSADASPKESQQEIDADGLEHSKKDSKSTF